MKTLNATILNRIIIAIITGANFILGKSNQNKVRLTHISTVQFAYSRNNPKGFFTRSWNVDMWIRLRVLIDENYFYHKPMKELEHTGGSMIFLDASPP